MKYEFSPSLQILAEDIAERIFPHVIIERVKCFRSYGSSTKHTIARCHALGKLLQEAMEVKPFYALEFLGERFNKMPEEEKVKVMIHELMHIPETFGGGFKNHNVVNDKNVEECYKAYKYCVENNKKIDWFKLRKQKKKFIF
ncbi:MAG: putative metallopeptidase [Nanoarchaeota archaeon]|nr:putative metallopeptidase [Nanoarchaeota archaeon]